MRFLLSIVGVVLTLHLTNKLSYTWLKRRVVDRRKWDLNICCGKTDGGGVNADIVRHDGVANFVEIDSVYRLPFKNKEFKTVLCSHTLEHVEDPDALLGELKRVGEDVVVVLPPLWDVSAALNFLEHKWIFLTVKKEHTELPPRIPMPLARRLHERIGQRIRA